MLRRGLILAAVLALPLLVSCSNTDDPENARSVIEVARVNEGGAFTIGMLDAGGDRQVGTQDDFEPSGHTSITLRNRGYNAFITAPDGSPYGSFQVTRVVLEWISASRPVALTNLVRFNHVLNVSWVVPRDEEATFSHPIATFELKDDPFFQGLINGVTQPFTATARLTLRGHETGSNHDVEFVGYVACEYIGVLVEQ